jgi:hypothetical protein
MAKLTQKQINRLESIKHRLERAEKWILSDRIAVCSVDKIASTTAHFTNPGQQFALYSLTKETGSELCQLYNTKSELEMFITEHNGSTESEAA